MNEEAVRMIKTQLEPRGIGDRKILSAFERVPRHLFVPEPLRKEAYSDHPLPIGEGQTISQPYMVARMAQLLSLSGREKVLEIGTGSGYQTAILAELSSEVYSVEIIASLSRSAQAVLEKAGYKNIRLKIADGNEGWSDEAPFDRILATAASETVPAYLFEQLGEGGKMVIPLGPVYSQTLTVVKKEDGKMKTEQHERCVFVPFVKKKALQKNLCPG